MGKCKGCEDCKCGEGVEGVQIQDSVDSCDANFNDRIKLHNDKFMSYANSVGDCIDSTLTLENPFDYQEGGNHYKKEGVMDPAEWCKRRAHCPFQHNVIKYVDRHRLKGGIEDLRKAQQYLKFIAYIEYGENL